MAREVPVTTSNCRYQCR